MKSLLWILLGAVFIALLAQLNMEVGKVPVTGQSLAVLIVGALLGPRDGSAAVVLYLVAGALGLPVFAGGTSGTEVLLGPTGGYLIGFVPAAYLVGICQVAGWNGHLGKAFLAMILGTIMILVFGLGRLALMYGMGTALEEGLYPVLPGAAVKIAIAAFLVYGWSQWKYR